MRNNEQGRSMIEMLGVLAIVGVLSVGGIAGYSKAMNKFKANKLIDQITMTSTNVKTVFSGQRDYNGLNLSIAAKVGALPAEMYKSNEISALTSANVLHAFGGGVALTVGDLNAAGDDLAYLMTIKDVPTDACIAVLTTDFGSDATVAYGVADVTTTYAGANGSADIAVPGDSQYPMPFSVVNAQLACDQGANNVVYFKFK